MNELLKQYINKDVLFHFVELIHDLKIEKATVTIFDFNLWDTLINMELNRLIPFVELRPGVLVTHDAEKKKFIEKALLFAKKEKSIVAVKKPMINLETTMGSFEHIKNDGADIRIVDNILDAMVIASKKRRNNVMYVTDGYEDEALITAAGLAKAKTVGFRRFFVYQNHLNTASLIKKEAENGNDHHGFLIGLKTGLNTGMEAYADIPLIYQKGVVISGYEAMEIMQSIYLLLEQMTTKQPRILFQRTKEVSEEVTQRARWMMDEVFKPEDFALSNGEIISNGHYAINEKYAAFDGCRLLN